MTWRRALGRSAAVAEFDVEWPTLGFLWSAWITRHCRVADRHVRGAPFVEYGWQRWCTANHGRIHPGAVHNPARPLLNQAFTVRRSLVIAPQKMGKGPWTAARVTLHAVGPCEFAGWAVAGDCYRCEEHGCACGWVYPYLPGEPMGMRSASPLIQIMATSDDQVANIWRPLTGMIQLGPLRELLLPRGEFIRIVGDNGDREMDRIDRVTASARSRLGAPVSEVFADESGFYTTSNKLIEVWRTMRRGVAGMGGRATETTNAPDPTQDSAAQRALESPSRDIFRYWRDPDGPNGPKHRDGSALSFRHKRERLRILRYVYAGADHINLDSIEAECAELMENDPAEAERFFGNRMVRGLGAWLAAGEWEGAHADAVAS